VIELALAQRLRETAEGFPRELVEAQLEDLPRVTFQVELILERVAADARVCDIGSGVGLFPAACAAAGMRPTMMDDFAPPFADEESARRVPDAPDAVNFDRVDEALGYHRSLGVDVVMRDPLEEGFGFAPASLDVVTSFDSMEHWHRSPKQLFAEIREALRPGGLFVLGVPNCVNLRKRLTVPFGYGKWSQMSHWYEPEFFRGHVREPDVDDLHYIARDLDLREVEILGRNWAGRVSPNPWLRRLTPLVDGLLARRPTLCSDLYLLGRKPV
jgi:SAM-dependent methyltransferase